MHRDRTIGGLNKNIVTRPLREREADYFAACFLMPRKLIITEFKKRFGNVPFKFDDLKSFQLCKDDPQSLLYSDREELKRELNLARCDFYMNSPIKPLFKMFGVSITSMAIRLNELELISWP